MRVAGERGGRDQPDVADDRAVGVLGDQVVLGPVRSVEERLVRRLRPRLHGVQRRPGVPVERAERLPRRRRAVRMAYVRLGHGASLCHAGRPAGGRMVPMELPGSRSPAPPASSARHLCAPCAPTGTRWCAWCGARRGPGTRWSGTRSGSTSTRPGWPAATPWSISPAPGSATTAGRTRTSKEIRDSRVLGTAAIAEAVASLDEPPRVLRQRQRDRLLRRHRRPGGGRERAARRRLPAEAVRGVGGGGGPGRRRRASGRSSPAPGWWWPARAGPGAGCSRCSRRASAGGWATAGSTGASSPCTTRSRRCGTSSTPTSLSGPVNLTAPDPVTNREVTAAMGRVLHRPDAVRGPGARAADRARRDGRGRAGQPAGAADAAAGVGLLVRVPGHRGGDPARRCGERGPRGPARAERAPGDAARPRAAACPAVCAPVRPVLRGMRDCADRSRLLPSTELGYSRSLLGA